jgi:cytochrome b subunit of formate dehydrogenase
VGFWTWAFSFMWGITGIYVVFPWPFQRIVGLIFLPDIFDPRNSSDQRILRWLSYLHFGEFGAHDWPLKVIWILAGLAPAVLFVSGFIMWWNRVLWPALRRVPKARARYRMAIENP